MNVAETMMCDVYSTPMVADFPPYTHLSRGLRHDLRRDGYPILMWTDFPQSRTVVSEVLLTGQSLKASDTYEGGFIRLLEDRLKLLRLRHYFALAYSRGGYC